MPGMPYGFGDLIARKYDIMQQQADTQRLGMVASANLDDVKAGLLPAQQRAEIDLTGAQTKLAGANAGLAGANTRNVDESTKYVGDIARANIFNTRAQGGLYGAQTAGENQMTKIMPDLFKFRGLGANLGQIKPAISNMLRLGMIGSDIEDQ